MRLFFGSYLAMFLSIPVLAQQDGASSISSVAEAMSAAIVRVDSRTFQARKQGGGQFLRQRDDVQKLIGERWQPELERFGKPSLGGMFFLVEVLDFWSDLTAPPPDYFDLKNVQVFTERLRQLDPAAVATWTSAARKAAGESTDSDPWVVALHAIQSPFLFDGSQLRTNQSSAFVTRLASLSSDSVARWGRAANIDKIDAAFYMLSVNGLFQGDSFNQETFDSEISKAEKLLTERRLEKK